jgi:hypothetical protein
MYLIGIMDFVHIHTHTTMFVEVILIRKTHLGIGYRDDIIQ